MSEDGIGVNPDEVWLRANQVSTKLEEMSNLRDRFRDILDSAREAAGEIEMRNGFNSFMFEYLEYFNTVQEESMQLAENIRDAAGKIQNADSMNADEYDESLHGLLGQDYELRGLPYENICLAGDLDNLDAY
ncbi:hypothetical protein RIF23_07615 [Lipingzhangella sp. LS1_29]|uniref:Uncharacterized protein n=1 Tax=Lipingzhangella rawalii TaxID=2055835 RepID=A0ABU2H5N4_9ACTN|nr:hypothetical protein [Lipingzhangella rawalii]MDS1270159.1 hypothetical protein [Lipingzhangella rawalii]